MQKQLKIARWGLVFWAFGAMGCGAQPKLARVVDVPHVATAAPTPRDLPLGPAAEASAPPSSELSPSELVFVTHLGGKTIVVLDTNAADAWRATAPELERTPSGALELHARAAIAALPPSHRLEGERFTFYRGDKIVCNAPLGALAIGGALEEPGVDWAGSPQHNPPASPREIADEAWSYASKWLVAEVTLPNDCANATWGRRASLPPPVFPEVIDLPKETIERAAARFEGSSRYVDAQKGYDDWTAMLAQQSAGSPVGVPHEKWSESASATRLERGYAWRGQRYLSVGAQIEATCGFSPSAFTLFRIDHGKAEIVIERDRVPADGVLVDLNLDGHLEMLSGVSEAGVPRVEPFDDDTGPSSSLEIPYVGCPC